MNTDFRVSNDSVYIVLPAKDEGPRIGRVIQKIIDLGFPLVVVVNDGSSDNTAAIAQQAGAMVVSHPINLGPGAATQTGITYALEKGAEVIVTLDADAQHSPTDIERLVQVLQEEHLDVVIGSRFIQHQDGIPFTRRVFNRVANLFSLLYTGVAMSDSQSGFKVIHRRFAKKLNLSFNGFEFCTEFVSLLKRHSVKYKEEPIHVSYSKETLQKGQSLLNGVRMVLAFLRREL